MFAYAPRAIFYRVPRYTRAWLFKWGWRQLNTITPFVRLIRISLKYATFFFLAAEARALFRWRITQGVAWIISEIRRATANGERARIVIKKLCFKVSLPYILLLRLKFYITSVPVPKRVPVPYKERKMLRRELLHDFCSEYLREYRISLSFAYRNFIIIVIS